MDILTKPINGLNFNDVVSFCQGAYREGIQIDYKQDLPRSGLAKYFAAFSNTKGGVIIVGVEEDRRTGIPTKWEGIDNNAQSIERIHQWASNVEPLPSYEVHPTDEQSGKIFILARIYEGDRTPYYVQNDSNIYIRTGNITNPVDLASPEAVELLFGKKEKAKLAREIYIRRTQEVYSASLEKGEKERLNLIAVEKENYQIQAEIAKERGEEVDKYRSSYIQNKIGDNTSMLTLLLQPFFPRNALIAPKEIIDKREVLRFTSSMGDFPNLNLKPIQDGAISFEWGYSDGDIRCHQIYSNGLIYSAEDVLRQDAERGRRIYISHIAANLFIFLKAASNFYSLAGYQGGLVGYVQLQNINGAALKRIVPNGWRPGLFWDDEKEVPLMNEYKWKIEIDTSLITDNSALQSYFINFIREIYWGFGYEDLKEEPMKAFLKDNGWLVQ